MRTTPKTMSKKILSFALALILAVSILSAPLNVLAVQTYYSGEIGNYDTSNGQIIQTVGTSLLVTSDIHGMQGDVDNGRLFNMLSLADPDKQFAALLVNGDYESVSNYIIDLEVVEAVNEIVDAYYGSNDFPVVYEVGNHERDSTDAEFAETVGYPRTGYVLTGYKDDTDKAADKPLYFAYSLGWHGEGTDVQPGGAGNHTYGGFNLQDLEDFKNDTDALKASYDTSGVDFDSIPIIVMSHTPLHYLSNSRKAENADKAIETFNAYTNVLFTWGHNHTEADPMYTNILEPGDIITYNATGDTSEILFSYVGIGALRANGHLAEVGYKADIKPGTIIDGKTGTLLDLQYYRCDTDTNEIFTLNNSDSPLMDEDTSLFLYSGSANCIDVASITIPRPMYNAVCADTATTYSTRFNAGDITWIPADDNFSAETVYTAQVELTVVPNYEFGAQPQVFVNGNEATVISNSAETITVEYTFPKTAAIADNASLLIDKSNDIRDDGNYAVVSGKSIAAALDYDFLSEDVYVDGNKVITVIPDTGKWISVAAEGGYYFVSADGEYLGLQMRREFKIISTSTPTTLWTIDEYGYFVGTCYDSDSIEYKGYLNYDGKRFSSSTTSDETSAKLYAVPLTIVTESLPDGTVGTAYSQTLTTASSSTITWSISFGNLPDGLSLNSDTGEISGTPTASGTSNFTVKASNGVSPDATKALSITVKATDTQIDHVAITVSAPSVGGTPSTTANGAGSFSIGTVSWSGNPSVFLANTSYTATVTLTANAGYSFTDLSSATINGQAATVTNNTGASVTLSCQFPATSWEADHGAYVFGYPDGSFKPDNAITRAEAAQMFYNISKQDPNAPEEVNSLTFTDVETSLWYSDAIEYLANAGVISGYPDGSFKPEATITRAEFSALAVKYARLANVGYTPTFPDVPSGYWADSIICTVKDAGYVSGYPNGNFRPDDSITRAQTVVILNRILGREASDLVSSGLTVPFNDVLSGYWAYWQIIEAAVTHAAH